MLHARSLVPIFATAVTCAAVAAQTVTATACTAASFDVTTKLLSLPAPILRTLPMGVNVDKIDAAVSLGNSGRAAASLRGAFRVSDTLVEVELTEALDAYTATASSWIGPARYLLTAAASAPVHATLELEWRLSASVGCAVPRIEVDVGNDGFFDLVPQEPNTTMTMPVLLAAAPLQIVLRTSSIVSSNPQAQAMSQGIRLRLRPDPKAVIATFTPSCGPTGMLALPTFDGSLRLACAPPTQNTLLYVLGLRPAPLPLPPDPACLLIPAAHYIGLLGVDGVLLPMASARPIRLWAQAVELVPTGAIVGTNSMLLDYR